MPPHQDYTVYGLRPDRRFLRYFYTYDEAKSHADEVAEASAKTSPYGRAYDATEVWYDGEPVYAVHHQRGNGLVVDLERGVAETDEAASS